jgi:hypothetical protein
MSAESRRAPTSRDIWSHGSGTQIRDLLSSCLATLLLMPASLRPVYFSSPWMSDFVLLENHFRQFSALFPELDGRAEIRFSEYLEALAQRFRLRLIATRNDTSKNFLASSAVLRATNLESRFAPDEHHEKGILTPWFYIEGSMNITYSGVHVRGEKITYHVGADEVGRQKIARAYLEFDRYWGLLR